MAIEMSEGYYIFTPPSIIESEMTIIWIEAVGKFQGIDFWFRNLVYTKHPYCRAICQLRRYYIAILQKLGFKLLIVSINSIEISII